MIKLILGTFLFLFSVAISFTGIGIIVGIPMAISGLGMMFMGMGSLTKSTVKGGIAAARFIKEQKQDSKG
ncbi:MAG TPA: hypothetical protein VGN82_17060 [Bosea sp. (in: a-proteobacteria)]|jgi:hypothetical protein|uniref:hypothetical protein n=1 Tax=Bosea sp. (in: a-proteobacteria) TaxID=1871050 RepID=UPI002E0E7EAE|nr:hypothetical protein [Bosea sp. (in: a-proteobacteria)]